MVIQYIIVPTTKHFHALSVIFLCKETLKFHRITTDLSVFK